MKLWVVTLFVTAPAVYVYSYPIDRIVRSVSEGANGSVEAMAPSLWYPLTHHFTDNVTVNRRETIKQVTGN